MLIRYVDGEGKQLEVEMASKALTIGRDAEADIVVPSEKASRIHCTIRLWDGDYVIKDMKSRNGTFVNDARVEVALLKAGDRIRIGTSTLQVERKSAKGTTTILREVGEEMEEGKGYRTILREIVQNAEDKPKSKE